MAVYNGINAVQKISRFPNQNGVSPLYIVLELHHSGWECLVYSSRFVQFFFMAICPSTQADVAVVHYENGI